jgi:hypothetical protein
MTDTRLYALTIPEGSQTRLDATVQQQQALQAVLGSDTGSVESIATDPGERPLTVEYPDEYAAIRAAELRELAQGLSQPVPYYGIGTSTPEDGYYTVSRVSEAGPVDPRSDAFQRVRATLTREGTRSSHWRAVTADSSQVDHPFGSVLEAPVGVPAAASKVRWYDSETEAVATPTVQTTRTTADGDVDILDADAAPYDAPEVIYELAYDEEGLVDPRVWDTRGLADRTDGNGALQWQKVFAASHDYTGDVVLENGLLRLTVDEPADPGIQAERYTSGSWSSVSLGASSWEVFDWDVRTIGLARVAGVAEFTDGSSFHTLSWRLDRGAEDVLWSTSDSEGPVPSDLQTLLDPIAAEHIYDPFGSETSAPQGLRSREEVA